MKSTRTVVNELNCKINANYYVGIPNPIAASTSDEERTRFGRRSRRRRRRSSHNSNDSSHSNAGTDDDGTDANRQPMAFVVSSRGCEIRDNPSMPSALQVPPPPLQRQLAPAPAPAQAPARRIDPRRKAMEEAAAAKMSVAVTPRSAQLLDTQSVNATGWFKALSNVHRIMANQQMAFVNAELRKFHAAGPPDGQRVFDLAFVRENELLQMVSGEDCVGGVSVAGISVHTA